MQIWRGDGFGVDDDSRCGMIAELSPGTEELVQDRLWGIMDELEARFGCDVSRVSSASRR